MASKTSTCFLKLALVIIASLAGAMAQSAPLLAEDDGQASGKDTEPGPDRVAHYAVVSCGSTHGSAQHKKWYWSSNQRIHRMLKENYGYPDESIYRLYEEGKSKAPAIDGRSSLVNFRRVFDHLAWIMKKDDHLFVYIVGHGGPAQGDYVHDLTDGKLTATEFGRLLDALPSRNVVVVMNPCYSGGFIPKLSAPGRVICTSTTGEEGNSAGWEGYMTQALAGREGTDANGDGRISIKEAYNASIGGTAEWYRKKNRPLREHPLLDDNGDGVGHFGKAPVVEGDGQLAARTFLGAHGHKLNYEEPVLNALRKANGRLKLD